jgi:hypothetical protein
MLVKTSTLIGPALDWAVSIAIGDYNKETIPCYSTDWTLAGPIIDLEDIEIRRGNPLYFPDGNENGDFYEPVWIAGKQMGTTQIVAAMRFFVNLIIGEDIEIPEELEISLGVSHDLRRTK